MDTSICMAGSLYCSRETITTLLIGYTPIQNKKFKRKKDYFKWKADIIDFAVEVLLNIHDNEITMSFALRGVSTKYHTF